MKNNAVRLVLAVSTLILGAAGEELLPKVLEVGFPLLLAAVVCFAVRFPVAIAILVALGAGASEDAISSLPFFTSVSFFLLVGTAARLTQLPYLIAPFAFPLYQVWLCLWTPDLSGSVFTRILVSFPIGVLTVAAVATLLSHVERKAAVHEAE